ncbi:MAG TPA: YHYH protein [Candidatus Acidoferrum sp.]|nr:YHYH protein [Candidatus Acidoferrum sp.]
MTRLPLVLLLLLPALVRADDASDAVQIFALGEQQYGKYFSPAGASSQILQGYIVRYYKDTNTYLGVKSGVVYVYGQQFGVGIVAVGSVASFIGTANKVTDLTDLILSRRSANCLDYAGSYSSTAKDYSRNLNFTGSLSITVSNGVCTFTSNNIPNHTMGQGGNFATPVSAQSNVYKVTTAPVFAAQNTALSLTWNSAVLLNGVRVDMLAAACYNVGDEKIGCNNDSQPWRFDPMYAKNGFGTDNHNAHTQPDGSYHYHGNPNALFDFSGTVISPVVGFAADGFPLYGPYIKDSTTGAIRKVKSSYQLKSGSRGTTSSTNPGGTYDGTYRDDWQYVAGAGDLDVCNGMTVNGIYAYYITDEYPYMTNCFRGTPDSTFRKGPAGNAPP